MLSVCQNQLVKLNLKRVCRREVRIQRRKCPFARRYWLNACDLTRNFCANRYNKFVESINRLDHVASQRLPFLPYAYFTVECHLYCRSLGHRQRYRRGFSRFVGPEFLGPVRQRRRSYWRGRIRARRVRLLCRKRSGAGTPQNSHKPPGCFELFHAAASRGKAHSQPHYATNVASGRPSYTGYRHRRSIVYSPSADAGQRKQRSLAYEYACRQVSCPLQVFGQFVLSIKM